MDKIFGYDWEDIQRAQQKQGSLNKLVQPTHTSDIEKYKQVDLELLNKHGIDKLVEMGYAGTVDRLIRSGVVNNNQ